MRTLRIDCEVQNIRTDKKATVKGLLVDTGAELTWLPQEVLAGIGIAIVKKDQQFVMANGQTITRSIGYVILRSCGFETVDEAVFGQPGDMAILGSHALEGFGAVVDPRRKKLVAAGPYPATATAYGPRCSSCARTLWGSRAQWNSPNPTTSSPSIPK